MKKWKKVLAAGLLTVLFSNAVCGQAVSAEKGGEILYADAMGQAIRTATEGKGPPFRAGRVQERGLQSVEKEKIAYHKEDAEHGNSQKRRLCSTTKEDAEHVNSQKRRLCSTTGEEAKYSSGIKTGDKGTSGYEKDMESGQMSGTGQNSGLETGGREKSVPGTSAGSQKVSGHSGLETEGMQKVSGRPGVLRSGALCISGQEAVQKSAILQNSVVESKYKQKNRENICAKAKVDLMTAQIQRKTEEVRSAQIQEKAKAQKAEQNPDDLNGTADSEPHVDAESPEDPGSPKEPERSDNAETGTGEKQPDNSFGSGNTEVSQGNEQEEENTEEENTGEENTEEENRKEEEHKEEQDTLEKALEEPVPGQYSRISDMHMRSAVTSTIQVGWKESLGSIDPGLLSLDDPYNVSIKYVDSSDTGNPDMRGKWRLLYCVQYQHNAPEGQITWDGAGRVSPSIAYLMYWGCRYWGKESLWPNYRTGYGWKYDALATQYAIHIVNGEFSLNTLYNHLKGSKKEQFYNIINKMVNDANHPPYYTPFVDGWRSFDYTLSETSVTWTAQAYNGKEGFITKWINQNLSDGITDCSEYITSKKGTADNGATVIWKDSGDASAFRIWIPKSQYLLLQEKGAKVTASISGEHSLYLAGWVYKSNNSKYQMVTMLEGGGGSAAHKKTVTAQIPKKAVSCYIDLQKADKETGETKPQGNAEFSGAVYEVKNKAGTVVDKMTTNTSGKATSVPLATGTYTVKEITAPKGYELDKKTYTVTFTNTDLTQSVYRKSVRSEEPMKKGSVTLKKISSGSGKTLKGAVFYLYTGKNQKVGEYTTDEEGCIIVKDLPWNSYFFIEQTAPDGYELSDKKIEFAINKESTGKTVELTAENTPRTVKIVLEKEINADEINFANGNPIFLFEVEGVDLEGNSHILHGITEFTKEYVEQEKNNDNKVRRTITFLELPAGTYTAREMKVMRYSLKDITEISGGVRALDTVEFDLIQNDAGHAVFINRKDEWQDWSDTSVCENIILKREKVENE
ncbi:MSCRAMM family protein [Blautia marasmi]|uniref:MSCRAMM family protein n=1 Tax=Blautia marasmi TaxID=1917868 RepID=UPI00266C73C6|nr:SpaA isopeptide-forming pilin-related protein [Blautia marasmi]